MPPPPTVGARAASAAVVDARELAGVSSAAARTSAVTEGASAAVVGARVLAGANLAAAHNMSAAMAGASAAAVGARALAGASSVAAQRAAVSTAGSVYGPPLWESGCASAGRPSRSQRGKRSTAKTMGQLGSRSRRPTKHALADRRGSNVIT